MVGIALLAMAPGARAAEPQKASPFEGPAAFVPASFLDARVLAKLREKGLEPAALCPDDVFLRRVYIDMIGTMPEPQDVRAFLQDKSPNKRAELIEALFKRPEFADYWALKWCDVLRVKAEFPINLWPNAVQAYHRWIHDALRENMPYDRFARELLTSSGSNFRVPPVNFYRAVQGRDSAALAKAVALTFMGTRFEAWPEARRNGMAAFFSRVAYKGTSEWKEEIVQLDPAASGPVQAVFPDGTVVQVPAGEDPRVVFADWLIAPKNPWFARSIVNRVWSWLMGRGIIHEPDDIRPDNPPVNAELLSFLESDFANSHYDLRRLFRVILNSRTYQQSSVPRSSISQAKRADAEALFACYPVRRLDAEVLIDALCWIGGDGENYTSAIPEPFTFLPDGQRAIGVADGSIMSQFLELFGRPSRDTGMESERSNQPTDAQRLYMLSSTDVQKRIERSRRLRGLVTIYGTNQPELIRSVYLMILSRHPTPAELTAAEGYFKGNGQKQAVDDLTWALVNTKEFLYRH